MRNTILIFLLFFTLYSSALTEASAHSHSNSVTVTISSTKEYSPIFPNNIYVREINADGPKFEKIYKEKGKNISFESEVLKPIDGNKLLKLDIEYDLQFINKSKGGNKSIRLPLILMLKPDSKDIEIEIAFDPPVNCTESNLKLEVVKSARIVDALKHAFNLGAMLNTGIKKTSCRYSSEAAREAEKARDDQYSTAHELSGGSITIPDFN